MADFLPESTNACPTSPTTDIQPELPETQLGHVIGACSEDDGVPDIGVSIGLGEGSMLWLGELLKRDGADIGFVFHGPDGKRIVAPIWPSCEWQDVADLLQHHVAPILARLTSTTPTLGDMVMVPREKLESIAQAHKNWDPDAKFASTALAECAREAATMLFTAPASPIPTSVVNEGEPLLAREIAAQFYDKRDPLDKSFRDVAHNIRRGRLDDQDAVELVRFTLAHAALSPALDNTAVEGLRPFSEWRADHGDVLWWKMPIHESPYVGSPLDLGRSMKVEIYIGFEQHEFPIKNTGGWPFDESDEASLFWSPLPDVRAVTAACATVQTEKAR